MLNKELAIEEKRSSLPLTHSMLIAPSLSLFINPQNPPILHTTNLSLSLSLMGKYPISIVNQLSHGPILALEDVNISFFLFVRSRRPMLAYMQTS
mgnify:CR=1 FL=1